MAIPIDSSIANALDSKMLTLSLNINRQELRILCQREEFFCISFIEDAPLERERLSPVLGLEELADEVPGEEWAMRY